MKEVTYSRAAIRQLRALPGGLQKRIVAKIERYAKTGAGDVKRLLGSTYSRLRIGDYRVIFDDDGRVIAIIAVGHRREIYD